MHPSTQRQQVSSRPGAGRARAGSKAPLRLKVIAASLALAFGGTGASAAPQGGVVQAGAAHIVQTNPTRLDILQSTNRAIINWRSFSVAHNEHVNFQQPSRQAAMLNRVIGVDPSVILGRLTSNGVVFLVNANGVLFGPGSKIDVGSLIATTAGISNENFMAGRYRFDQVTNRFATVINRGEITAADGGLVALVAPGVENTGIIRANLGKVALASGHAFTLDLYGDQLIALAIDDKVAEKLTDPEGRPLTAYVNQAGSIEADGGTVLLTANVAKTVLDHVINLSGTIQARSFAQQGGEIVLYGGTEGTVTVAGSLDASGQHAGERGGSVQVLGENVQLAGTSNINVSGQAGGGTALVGGDWQGSGTTPRATNATVEAGSKISADAIASGNGGTVVVWAEGATRFAGEISARGGAQSGNGGNVEVSGKGTLSYTGLVDAAAPNGNAGTLLLDPTDWIIGTARCRQLQPSAAARHERGDPGRSRHRSEREHRWARRAAPGRASRSAPAIRFVSTTICSRTTARSTSLRGRAGCRWGIGSRATSNQGAVIFAGTQPITIDCGRIHQRPASHHHGRRQPHHHRCECQRGPEPRSEWRRRMRRSVRSRSTPRGGDSDQRADCHGERGAHRRSGARLCAEREEQLCRRRHSRPRLPETSPSTAICLHATGAPSIWRAAGDASPWVRAASTARARLPPSRAAVCRSASAQKLTVGDVLTTGSVRLESTADTVQLTKPLLGAKDTNGIGPLTIRTAADLTIDQPIKSTGGIDIQAGGADAASARALVVAVGDGQSLGSECGRAIRCEPSTDRAQRQERRDHLGRGPVERGQHRHHRA